ncbi:MAG: phage recombination protein Bet [Planctomycetota bacterium]
MTTATHDPPSAELTQTNGSAYVPQLSAPRLAYHPAVKERFGIDKASWKALTEAIFPTAESPESIILALSYCQARGLDIFKKPVHIVPIWNSQLRRTVETVWPGIGELRSTAFRTGLYAGRDATAFGEDVHEEWTYQPRNGSPREISVTFPEWAQVTVYRMVGGERVAFHGPIVYWRETYATMGKSDSPNSMWERRPRGQLEKCAEAAALRAAFPEEIGEHFTSDEAGGVQGRLSVASGTSDMVEGEVVSDQPAGDRVAQRIKAQQTEEAEDVSSRPDESIAEPSFDDAPIEPSAPEPVAPVERENPDAASASLNKGQLALVQAYAERYGITEREAEEGLNGYLKPATVDTLKTDTLKAVRARFDAGEFDPA